MILSFNERGTSEEFLLSSIVDRSFWATATMDSNSISNLVLI